MTVRAVLVDDNAEFLEAARQLLEREGMIVVGVATTCAEALRVVEEKDSDVVLVDVALGDESGFDVAECLTKATDGVRPIVLTSMYPEADLEDLIEASSAVGFVSKARLSSDAILQVLDRWPR
jgi:CheY-like chemotaxis protein